MRFVVFGSARRLGVIDGDHVLDLAAAADVLGTPDDDAVVASLLALIEAGDRGLDFVRSLMAKAREVDDSGLRTELASAQLHAPFPGRRFALAGSNNATHVANGFTNRGQLRTAEEVYETSRKGKAGGFWVIDPPVGPASDIPYPRSAQGLFDYEGEVAVVLGMGGKRLSADDAAGHIWGTTLVIDWSIRSQTTIQSRQPFYAHKIFDCSKSFGPWIAVGEVDPSSTDVETRVNGDLRQCFNTRDMMHSFGELMEQMSTDLTLHPGDVLSGGTGAGTATDSSPVDADGRLPLDRFLKIGDTVEVSSPVLGSLTARIVESD